MLQQDRLLQLLRLQVPALRSEGVLSIPAVLLQAHTAALQGLHQATLTTAGALLPAATQAPAAPAAVTQVAVATLAAAIPAAVTQVAEAIAVAAEAAEGRPYFSPV